MEISDILSSYEKSLDGREWKDEAVEVLRKVLIPAEAVVDGAIDYSKIRALIDAKNIDGILSRLRNHLETKGVRTNSGLVEFVEESMKRRGSLYSSSIRDVFCFHGTGASALKAMYTYMKDELKYCPFVDGYREKELVK